MVERAGPAKVILYGSHARQEAGPQSDVDLLVLFDELGDRRRVTWDLYEATIGMPFPKDIVISTVAEYERYAQVPNTLYMAALHEGKLIYERGR